MWEEDGFLTERKTGYKKKQEYFYVGHYDPAKKGWVWCSISEHDFAHITFNYVEYSGNTDHSKNYIVL